MRISFLLVFVWSAACSCVAAAEPQPIVGQTEQIYALAEENQEIRGLAVDDASADAPRLLVLDRSGRVFIYGRSTDAMGQGRGAQPTRFQAVETLDLKSKPANVKLTDPRGLALAVEDGKQVLYLVDLARANGAVQPRLHRYTVGTTDAVSIDLSLSMYCIGDREVFDVACDRGEILLAFDSAGYTVPDQRVQRGLARYRWNPKTKDLEFVKHMPDAGTEPSRGIAAMEFDGFNYLWATIGNEHIYCADGPTGRGLFFFNRPRSDEKESTCSGLCFGAGSLWVSENVPGPDRVHRVNVTRNLDAWYEGPRVLRRLQMTIRCEPEGDAASAGTVYHYYSRPYAYEQLHNQGVWLETESFADLSQAPNTALKSFTYDPAGDTAGRQTMWVAEYADGPARTYSSRYEIDLWTNPYKKYVYPHRVDLDRSAIAGTDYLADDPELYNLSDTKTYAAFIGRVKAHVRKKYDVEADMKNPYWAARNVVEYIQDNYYYPNREKRKPAAVDYDRKHYDANPANLKIELSGHSYDKNQIIACSGTSVMVAGAMRHLGFPARWLGTGTQEGPATWDKNKNGLLDPGETAPSTNGHRYSQVWLGSHYGWICFDATPSKPVDNDYDVPPPLQSQFRYMTRAASGHRADNRVVYNVGSALFRPLYRDFEYDPVLAVDNNCGGDQRYNLQGRFAKPELWKNARHRISLTNLCFVTDVKIAGPKAETRVTWDLRGAWDRCPGATLSIQLQRVTNLDAPRDLLRLASGVPHDAKSATVDLSAHRGKQFRIILRKDGDPETGGQSDVFDLE
jgi:hypothetical protein